MTAGFVAMGQMRRIMDLRTANTLAQLDAMAKDLRQRVNFLMADIALNNSELADDGLPYASVLDDLQSNAETSDEKDQAKELADKAQDLRDIAAARQIKGGA